MLKERDKRFVLYILVFIIGMTVEIFYIAYLKRDCGVDKLLNELQDLVENKYTRDIPSASGLGRYILVKPNDDSLRNIPFTKFYNEICYRIYKKGPNVIPKLLEVMNISKEDILTQYCWGIINRFGMKGELRECDCWKIVKKIGENEETLSYFYMNIVRYYPEPTQRMMLMVIKNLDLILRPKGKDLLLNKVVE